MLCSSSSHLQDWFSAAEAAIKAVYAVHPAPQVLHTMLWSCGAPWHTSAGAQSPSRMLLAAALMMLARHAKAGGGWFRVKTLD